MGRLNELHLLRHLSKSESEKRIAALQRRLLHLRLLNAGLLEANQYGPGLCVVFEGWDASGKGGAIKRLVARLDPRHVEVSQFGVPTDEERRRHFLWRFWPSLPGRGEMTVFDRSWYGRVLVERVEDLISHHEWQRAYNEIVNFEHSLVDEGTVLVKIWLHISPEEQLHRFESRASDGLRSWKLTEQDWRNRAKRSDYEQAIEEMLQRTDTETAPWSLIEGESKHFARVKVLETVIASVEQGMRRVGITPPPSQGNDFDPL